MNTSPYHLFTLSLSLVQHFSHCLPACLSVCFCVCLSLSLLALSATPLSHPGLSVEFRQSNEGRENPAIDFPRIHFLLQLLVSLLPPPSPGPSLLFSLVRFFSACRPASRMLLPDACCTLARRRTVSREVSRSAADFTSSSSTSARLPRRIGSTRVSFSVFPFGGFFSRVQG